MGGGLPEGATLVASGADSVAGADASAVVEGAGGGSGVVADAASVPGPTSRPASDDAPPLEPGVDGNTATSPPVTPEVDPAPEGAPLAVPLAATTGWPCDASLQPQPPMAVPTEPRIATTTLVRMRYLVIVVTFADKS